MSKVPFGLKDGRLVEPSQVNRGLECGCTCPECGARLVANQGQKKIDYFSHNNLRNCIGSRESSIHKAAKQILVERRELLLPGIYLKRRNKTVNRYCDIEVAREIKPTIIRFDSVVEECREYAGIVPDIEAIYKGNKLFIEFAYTHFIDNSKYEKLVQLGISTLEIDLSKLSEIPSMKELEQFLIQDNTNRKWIFNAKQNRLVDEVNKELDQRISQFKIEKENYLALNDTEKLRLEANSVGLELHQLPSFIDIFVPWQNSYKVNRRVWQASVYVNFIYENQGDLIEHEDICEWLAMKFEIFRSVNDSEKIAVWKYLTKLCELNILEKWPSKSFYVKN